MAEPCFQPHFFDSRKYDTLLPRFVAHLIDASVMFAFVYLASTWSPRGQGIGPCLSVAFIYTFPWLYYISMQARLGQTIGMMFAGIRLLDISERGLISTMRSIRSIWVWVIAVAVLLWYQYPLVAQYGWDDHLVDSHFDFGFWHCIYVFWLGTDMLFSLTNARRRSFSNFLSQAQIIRLR